jgi:hypothetical protein
LDVSAETFFARFAVDVQRAAGTTDIEIVAVNDLTDNKTLAHLLKYDSVLGRLPHDVSVEGDDFVVGDRRIKAWSIADGPAAVPCGRLQARPCVSPPPLPAYYQLDNHLVTVAPWVGCWASVSIPSSAKTIERRYDGVHRRRGRPTVGVAERAAS